MPSEQSDPIALLPSRADALPRLPRARLRRLILAVATGALVWGAVLSAAVPPARVAAAQVAAAVPSFPGPAYGVANVQAPPAGAWVTSCNSAVNSEAGRAGSTAIPAGTAIQAETGCGRA